jgi:hypothetical protein
LHAPAPAPHAWDRRRNGAPWPAHSPALVLELAMGLGARVLLGEHLRQNAVAQAQG